jgi:hypothetical protein
MEIFRWILPTLAGQECSNDISTMQLNSTSTFDRRSVSRSRRASISPSEQRTISSFEDNDDMFEDEDTFSDHSLVMLERREGLLEFGIALREQDPRVRRSSSERSRSRARAPPNTPVDVRPSNIDSSFYFPSRATFNETLPLIQNDLPTFIRNVSSYPISHIFASCFSEELEVANRDYLDANGDITISSCHVTANLKEIESRMDLLNDYIAFLESVVPPGR